MSATSAPSAAAALATASAAFNSASGNAARPQMFPQGNHRIIEGGGKGKGEGKGKGKGGMLKSSP